MAASCEEAPAPTRLPWTSEVVPCSPPAEPEASEPPLPLSAEEQAVRAMAATDRRAAERPKR